MKRPIILRRVVGDSMLPGLRSGKIVLGWRSVRQVRAGNIVILSHNGLEKIKHIECIDGQKLYVVGDNPSESTDSRQFGWIDRSAVLARVIWPRLRSK
jgi:phage repressor protein C with HTH and peptisase S24 domain